MTVTHRLCGAALLALCAVPGYLHAQSPKDSTPPPPRPWYSRITVRGYAQVRYNGVFQTNPLLVCQACDPNLGGVPGFSVRRARLAVQGGLHDQVQLKLEADLVQSVGTSLNVLQVRDLYGDVFLDQAKTYQLRIGISKVLYGWETMQSSTVRLAFDRTDAMSSGTPGDRDLGLMAMWAPAKIRERLKLLVDSGYKGQGDYGIAGLGIYNGQGSNRAELNGNKHVVARVSYPFLLPHHQVVEVGVQGFIGKYVVSQRTTGVGGRTEFKDERVAVSVILYPRPFGLTGEWTWGKGPEYVAGTNAIEERNLNGGYLQGMYRAKVGKHLFYPYARAQYYDGGKKNELDARYYRVRELEVGTEWVPLRGLEFTAAYMFSDRTFEDAALRDNQQKGSTMRLQAQLMY
jgi:hypothetical protein